MSIVDRITAFLGAEGGRATDFAHRAFQSRMEDHGHFGKALVQTVVDLSREHPNLVGIGVGLLVERMLVEERKRHDASLAEAADVGAHLQPAAPGATEPPLIAGPPAARQQPPMRDRANKAALGHLKPLKTAFEVFGFLFVLKFALFFARLFHRRDPHEDWLRHAARIRSISAALAVYAVLKSLRSRRLSALRIGAAGFFGARAIQPLANSRW